MKREATPMQPGTSVPDQENAAVVLAPMAKRQRLSRTLVAPRPINDYSHEKLAHLNKIAIQCLQSGECDRAQCVLLDVLDMIKARQMGNLPQNDDISTMSTCCTSSHDDLDHRVEARLDLYPRTDGTEPAGFPPALHDEGFRASMEPLCFGSTEHPAVQQAAIIYYNVGISFLCFQKLKQARSWFSLALVCFSDSTCLVDPKVMARLHANIGFSHQHDSPQEALKAYHLSLMIAHQSPELVNTSFLAYLFNAIGVLLYRMSQYGSAMIYLQDSLSHFKTLDGKEIEIATITHNMGRVHFAQLEFETALELFERALAARRRNKETSPVDLAASLCSVGSALEKLEREEEAVEFYAELIEMDCLERNPIDFTLVCNALASIYQRQEKVDEARSLYEKALRVGRDCLGETHPLVARCLKALADCHLKNGNSSEAVENYETALKLERQASKQTHLETLGVLVTIASFYQKLGHFTAALGKYSMVYDIQAKMFGTRSREAQKARVRMAEMEYRLNNYDAAFDIYQEVLQQKQASNDTDNSECSFLMNSLGMVCFAKGDFGLASKFFQSCLDQRTAWNADSATVLYNLATAEEKRGCYDRAIECFEKSLAMDETLGPDDRANTDIILDTLQRVGRIYQLSGDLHRALDCASKALNLLEAADDSSSRLVRAKLHNLSGNLYLQLGETLKMMESYRKAMDLFQANGDDGIESLIIAGFYLYGFSKIHPPCAGVA